jgi:putative hydrolase of the HAD superfamily
MPYHTTWSHESEASIDACGERMRTVPSPEGLPAAIQAIAGSAAAGRFAR